MSRSAIGPGEPEPPDYLDGMTMTPIDAELALLAEADGRAAAYLRSVATRRVFPDAAALDALQRFDEPLPEGSTDPAATLALLDAVGTPATVTSNGPRYHGFVIGATLPAAAAAERLMAAWDQCGSSWDNSPAAATLERIAAGWVLDILDLPRAAAVGFGTSATACGIACLAAARRSLLARACWDLDAHGVHGAPEIRVVVSDLAHITVLKALRVLGFGRERLLIAATDAFGRIDPHRLPPLDTRTILCLQAGEVNTGEFDPLAAIIPAARAAGAWVHVDGAFGLWARAAPGLRALTEGVEQADSWTTDGHKFLNTPYDGAMAICRDAVALAEAMNGDASYSMAAADAQKNLTLEFSRRPRGIPIWAALRSLGRAGVAALVTEQCMLAGRLRDALVAGGFQVLNRVVLNQLLVRADTDERTRAIQAAAATSGDTWFGLSSWRGQPAFRLSLSSWRTTATDIDATAALLIRLRGEIG